MVVKKIEAIIRPEKYEDVQKAIDKNVLIIPGNVFSSRDTHFRLSYATTDAKLQQGLTILRELAHEIAR